MQLSVSQSNYIPQRAEGGQTESVMKYSDVFCERASWGESEERVYSSETETEVRKCQNQTQLTAVGKRKQSRAQRSTTVKRIA